MDSDLMPNENYYRDHPLSEQLQLFIDHHYDRKTRHISKYEAEMLNRAADVVRNEE